MTEGPCININWVGTEYTEISIIRKLHRPHTRGRIQELSKGNLEDKIGI